MKEFVLSESSCSSKQTEINFLFPSFLIKVMARHFYRDFRVGGVHRLSSITLYFI